MKNSRSVSRFILLQVPIILTYLYMVLVPEFCLPSRRSLQSIFFLQQLTPFTSPPQGFTESRGVGKDKRAQNSLILLCKVHIQ